MHHQRVSASALSWQEPHDEGPLFCKYWTTVYGDMKLEYSVDGMNVSE